MIRFEGNEWETKVSVGGEEKMEVDLVNGGGDRDTL
jgi:hypothetical protein